MIESKLPEVGTTIFTVMSALAGEYSALNLSQGFPNFDAPSGLASAVSDYISRGFNQYAPMAGVSVLRERIASKIEELYRVNYRPDTEITITSGGTEALFAAISTVVRPGDEVIIFEPAYDSYVPAVKLNGGVPVFVRLTPPDYSVNWEIVKQKITARTRLILLNTPHNPTGAVLTPADLEKLAELIRKKNIFLVSDEVYEHIVFDGKQHVSLFSNAELRERTFVCSSFGKTYHVTGWKVGYCLAPAVLTSEFRKIHQYLTFSTITPVQYALADFLLEKAHYLDLSGFYQKKRDLFLNGLAGSGFAWKPAAGTYFQMLSYKNLSREKDAELAIRITREYQLASIPVSAFYHDGTDHHMLRFCFAKDDETIQTAAKVLVRFSEEQVLRS